MPGLSGHCFLPRFKASSAAINVSPSAKLYLQWENIVTVTPQGWLKSCRLLRWMSSHQNESRTRIIAFRGTLIAPRGIIHPRSVLVWRKKNEMTKRKFGFNEVHSTEMREIIKQLNMSAWIYLQADRSSFSLLPLKSHKHSNSGLVTEYPWSLANHRISTGHIARSSVFQPRANRITLGCAPTILPVVTAHCFTRYWLTMASDFEASTEA